MLLMLLLGAVALAVAVAFAFVFAVAVAVTDIRLTSLISPIRLYPSLSFVEYNLSQDGFFTPLVYFLAGHYLDP